VDSEPYEKCGEGNRVALRISVTSFIAIVVLGLAWQLCGYTQDKPKASSKVPGADSNVSCYDESGRLVGPNKMRTFVLESPDGTYRAYAETEAVTHKKRNATGDEYVECENTSRLFVAGPQSYGFRQVMTVLPKVEPEPSGNDIGLVDWSPKGHRLLIAEGLFWHSGDFGGIEIRIYDADSHKLSSESFVEEVFRKHGRKDCIGVFQPEGFSGDGGIIVRAGPYFDVGEEQPSPDSCVAKEGVWLIGSADDAIRHLPDNYKPKHYGKEVAGDAAP
jgi:hypothetical protein